LSITEGDSPGLSQEDMQASIATLRSIAESLNLEMVQLRERKEGDGMVTEHLLRKTLDYDDFMEVR
jgi:GTPase